MSADRRNEERDPVVEAYKEGIDRTLLREQLKRTPTERIEEMMRTLELVEALRESVKRGPIR